MRISDWSSDVCSSDLIRSSTCQSCPTKSLCVLMTLNAISHDITAWTMMIHQRMLSRIERISRNMKYKARSPAERSMASVLAVNERRSEERREGKEWVRTVRSGGEPVHLKKNKKQ